MGKIRHVDVGRSIKRSEWESEAATHLIEGEADLDIVRSVTYVVAANNSPTHLKAMADYVCDGTADEVQVQAAITAGLASGVPFTIVLLPGSYDFASTVSINANGFNHLYKISGYGAEITYTGGAETGVFYLYDNTLAGSWNPLARTIVEGFHLTGNDSGTSGIYLRNMTNVLLQDLNITGFASSNNRWAIYITDQPGGQNEYTTIRRCNIWDNTTGIGIYSTNGGAANFKLEDSIISNINVANVNSILLVLGGGTVARSSIDNTSFHLGGAAGQIGVYVATDINGMVFTNAGFDNHSAVNAVSAFVSTAAAAGTFYINGLQGSTAGGTLTFVNFALGSLTAKIRGSDSYVTENSGTGTLLDSNTTVVIAHGLDVTPTIITITWLENPTNAIGDWWVDTIGAANFTLNGVDPGASNLDFFWEAKAWQ